MQICFVGVDGLRSREIAEEVQKSFHGFHLVPPPRIYLSTDPPWTELTQALEDIEKYAQSTGNSLLRISVLILAMSLTGPIRSFAEKLLIQFRSALAPSLVFCYEKHPLIETIVFSDFELNFKRAGIISTSQESLSYHLGSDKIKIVNEWVNFLRSEKRINSPYFNFIDLPLYLNEIIRRNSNSTQSQIKNLFSLDWPDLVIYINENCSSIVSRLRLEGEKWTSGDHPVEIIEHLQRSTEAACQSIPCKVAKVISRDKSVTDLTDEIAKMIQIYPYLDPSALEAQEKRTELTRDFS